MALQEYSKEAIAEIFIIGGMGFCAVAILTFCSIIAWCRRISDNRTNMLTRRRSNNSIVRSQSHSMVRGEHPMAFMLPSVSLSEAGSETDSMSCYSSDVDLGPMSPMASMTGSNIYSQSLALLSPQPHNSSPRSLPVSSRPHSRSPKTLPRFSSLPRQDAIERKTTEQSSLGKVGVRLTYKSDKSELLVKILRAENIPINYKTQTANTSVKIVIMPSKLVKYSTNVIEDCVNPEYNEEFSYNISKDELHGKVIKLSVADHDSGSGGKKVIGFCVVTLDTCGLLQNEADLQVKEMWLNIQEKVSEELSNYLADRLELSLRYDSEHGRLSLGIQSLRIFSLQTLNNDLDIYVKVTLYEGSRLIKAKKTRLLSCSEVLDFNEKFSIRLPSNYLEAVSCVVSLCSRNKIGVKGVMGRTTVGPYTFATGEGLEQWHEMTKNPCVEVIKWHKMLPSLPPLN